MRLTGEQAIYLGRMLMGGVLAWIALWVAFGPEVVRVLGRLGLRRVGAGGSLDGGDATASGEGE